MCISRRKRSANAITANIWKNETCQFKLCYSLEFLTTTSGTSVSQTNAMKLQCPLNNEKVTWDSSPGSFEIASSSTAAPLNSTRCPNSRRESDRITRRCWWRWSLGAAIADVQRHSSMYWCYSSYKESHIRFTLRYWKWAKRRPARL